MSVIDHVFQNKPQQLVNLCLCFRILADKFYVSMTIYDTVVTHKRGLVALRRGGPELMVAIIRLVMPQGTEVFEEMIMNSEWVFFFFAFSACLQICAAF